MTEQQHHCSRAKTADTKSNGLKETTTPAAYKVQHFTNTAIAPGACSPCFCIWPDKHAEQLLPCPQLIGLKDGRGNLRACVCVYVCVCVRVCVCV